MCQRVSCPPSDRMAINIGYFGLSLNTTNLSGDPFLNCFLSAVTEVPAYIVSTFLLKSCPRRPVLSAFLIIGGGFLLLVQLIPESKSSQTPRLLLKPSSDSGAHDLLLTALTERVSVEHKSHSVHLLIQQRIYLDYKRLEGLS